MIEDTQVRILEEGLLKLERDAEEEIRRFVGESTEYLAWLGGSAAAFASVAAACRKLGDLAQDHGSPLSEEDKIDIEQRQLFGDAVMLTALALEETGAAIEQARARHTTLGRVPVTVSLADFGALVRKYVSAHRLGYRLWEGRDRQRLLFSRPVGSPN